METWKIIALSAVGLIWLASIVFVAWLYPDKPKILPFRKKSKQPQA